MGVQARFEEIQSLAFGSIVAGYTVIGTMQNAISVLLIQNLTDAAVLFSTNGSMDMLILPAYSGIVFDTTANRSGDETGLFFIKGTQIYVKQSGVPTVGSVYVSAIYDASN